MSDLKSVLAFFIGLVFFILLVVFAIGRIRMSGKPATTALQPTITLTLTPSPTPVGLKAAQKPSLLSQFLGWFAPKKSTKVTPTITPTPSPVLSTTSVGATLGVPTSPPASLGVNTQMKQALKPTVILYAQTKGGIKQPTVNTVSGVATIPETGAETFVLPLASAFAGLGIYLKKKK